MNSDSPDKPELKITGAAPDEVPSFACIVYVSAAEGGGVRARVGNLEGIDLAGKTERDALARVVPEFKARVASFIAEGSPVPWIDPPSPPRPGEQKRFLPVHL